jgi:16S rRNA (guanine1516-N2)-methyltransferase
MNNAPDIRIAIYTDNKNLQQDAKQLATAAGLEITDKPDHEFDYMLMLTLYEGPPGHKLELIQTGAKTPGPVFAEFAVGTAAHRMRYGGGRGQPLARAVGLKGGASPNVLDVTAGLGRDAFVLATLGCLVIMVERNPIIAALLDNGMQRAADDASVGNIISERMHLVQANALEYVDQLSGHQQPDVIYMDPMYPHRTKSALVKKEMRFFRDIVGEDEDASLLLKKSLQHAQKRVVVKRPRTAKPLPVRSPDTCIESKNTRYDIYFTGVKTISK